MFASVVRRPGEDISFTIVNKGGRMPKRFQYEEYILSKSKLGPLFLELEEVLKTIETESIYETFEKVVSEKFKLNVVSKDQKVGNYFIKELETAIKYTYSTRDFSTKNL